jgi:ribosomal protein S6
MIEQNLKQPRVYELGYVLSPVISEENLDEAIDVLRKVITDTNGLPISEGRAELIELAYTMTNIIENKKQDFDKGYFGWIKFDATPDAIAVIKKALDGMSTLVRHIIITTVRENTMVDAKVYAKSNEKKQRPSTESVKKPDEEVKTHTPEEPTDIDEEEVDAKIDELASDGKEE